MTFDGHLHELPGSCPLLLAQDVSNEPSFTLLLNPDSRSLLKLWLNNSTIEVQTDGQVCSNWGEVSSSSSTGASRSSSIQFKTFVLFR